MQTKLVILKKYSTSSLPYFYISLAHLSHKLKLTFLIKMRRLCLCRRCRKLFTFLSSSPETLDLFQPNFAQNIIGKRGFKFELDTVIRTVIPARKCFPLNLRHPLAYKQNSLCIQIACRQYNNNLKVPTSPTPHLFILQYF